MEQKDTRERILDESLRLFAQKGFEATSVADIASAVHIKAPSLYKHYASKQAIFDALLDRELARHVRAKTQMGFSATSPVEDAQMYEIASLDSIGALAAGLFSHWTNGDAAAFRQLLSAERLRSAEMARLYDELMLKGPLAYQAQVFGAFVQAGLFREAPAEVLAVQFWGPVLMLMERADCGEDKNVLEHLVVEHVRRFGELNGKGEQDGKDR